MEIEAADAIFVVAAAHPHAHVADITIAIKILARILVEQPVAINGPKVHAVDEELCENQEAKMDQLDRPLELIGDLTEEQRGRLLEIADKCPVHRTLEAGSW